ncbi:betaine--homocysteine S-methyltransferase 1-like, partial [Ruditapes philippinarum]|uniref:betaine--homocysteine S-methyltransferase 1-like n=1 Tax=Ruditapes philippinarum TaxID=129788 RepID=UPI00295BB1DD
YFGHRAFMKLQGREDESEKLNRDALTIARRVADKYGKLIAGGLSDTPLYSKDDKESHQTIYEISKEQVIWCVEGGVDYIIGESFDSYGEAQLALRAIKEYGKGCPAVITMAAHIPDFTTDDIPIPEALKRLEDQGAAVVGINCSRGQEVMMSLLKVQRGLQ